MPPMQQFDWGKIRAEYEAGSTQSELSRRYNVSRKAIQNHIKSEQWMQDVARQINRLTVAKSVGVEPTSTPEETAEAMSAAADERVAVIRRHRAEWEEHKAIIAEALATNDFEKAKLAKITAETIRLRQDGERKAWGIDLMQQQQSNQQAQVVNIDFSTRSQSELITLVREAYGTATHECNSD